MNANGFYESYWQSENAPPQFDPTTAHRVHRLERALRSFAKGSGPDTIRVLDAGCGDGASVGFLRDKGFRVSGIDLSAAAIEKAKARCPDADLRVGSLEERLPFADASFDAVWCTEVLEHVFSVHDALCELNRVLRFQGSLVLTTPYHGFIKNLLITLLRFDKHYNPDISHIRFFTRATLERSLRRAGFVPVAWGGVGRVWPIWKSFFVTARKEGPPGQRPTIIG